MFIFGVLQVVSCIVLREFPCLFMIYKSFLFVYKRVLINANTRFQVTLTFSSFLLQLRVFKGNVLVHGKEMLKEEQLGPECL